MTVSTCTTRLRQWNVNFRTVDRTRVTSLLATDILHAHQQVPEALGQLCPPVRVDEVVALSIALPAGVTPAPAEEGDHA